MYKRERKDFNDYCDVVGVAYPPVGTLGHRLESWHHYNAGIPASAEAAHRPIPEPHGGQGQEEHAQAEHRVKRTLKQHSLKKTGRQEQAVEQDHRLVVALSDLNATLLHCKPGISLRYEKLYASFQYDEAQARRVEALGEREVYH